jgi:hypothetical protein
MILEQPGELRLGDPVLVPHGRDAARYTRKLLREQYPLEDLMEWGRRAAARPRLRKSRGATDTYQTYLNLDYPATKDLLDAWPAVTLANTLASLGLEREGKHIRDVYWHTWNAPYVGQRYPCQIAVHPRTFPGCLPLAEIKEWIKENHHGDVYFGIAELRFQHERDAVLFKMRWL